MVPKGQVCLKEAQVSQDVPSGNHADACFLKTRRPLKLPLCLNAGYSHVKLTAVVCDWLHQHFNVF